MKPQFKIGDMTFEDHPNEILFEYLRFIYDIKNGYSFKVYDGYDIMDTAGINPLSFDQYEPNEYLYTDIFRNLK